MRKWKEKQSQRDVQWNWKEMSEPETNERKRWGGWEDRDREMIDGAKMPIFCFIWSALLCNQKAHMCTPWNQHTYTLSTSISQTARLQSACRLLISSCHHQHTVDTCTLQTHTQDWWESPQCRQFWSSCKVLHIPTQKCKLLWIIEKWNAAQTAPMWKWQYPTMFYNYFGFCVLDQSALPNLIFYFVSINPQRTNSSFCCFRNRKVKR